VDFRFDVTEAKAARVEIDWNSKKAGKWTRASVRNTYVEMFHTDDDHIETMIFTRFTGTPISDAEDALGSRADTPAAEIEDNEEHGKTIQGTVACCRKFSEGVVNCESCLKTALRVWTDQSDTNEREVARRALDMLDVAGIAGLDINTFLVSTISQILVTDDELRTFLPLRQRLRSRNKPAVRTPVSCQFWDH
jgi:oxalate---CoA ligase